VIEPVADEVRADEAGGTRDEQTHAGKSRRVPVRVLGIALALAIFGCQSDEDHLTREDVSQAQEDADVPIYWLGESFDALPLTNAEVEGRGRALLVYGECDGESEGGDSFHCTKPQIQIQQFPFASVAWRVAAGCKTLPSIRGVPTLRHDGLVLVTGDGIVKIYARTRAEDVEVARRLTRVDGRGAGFPPPSRQQRRIVAAGCA
jgi:hypothetical protein